MSLPHSVEAEQGVLGSMLRGAPQDVIAKCVEKITPDHFYVPAHRTIFSVLMEMWSAEEAVDLITVTQVLRDRNLLEKVGGAHAYASLCPGGDVRTLSLPTPGPIELTLALGSRSSSYSC